MVSKSPFDSWKDKNHEDLQNIKKEAGERLRERAAKPWDLLNPNKPRSNEELANERYNICLSCPELIQLTKQCKKCGCFMAVKTKLKEAVCPIGKW